MSQLNTFASLSAALDPIDSAAALYRPTADTETRRAVARLLEARRRIDETTGAKRSVTEALGEHSKPADRLRSFLQALYKEEMDAQAHLIRILVSWDERATEMETGNAETRYWPPRGAIVDDVLYLVAPEDPDDCVGLEPGTQPTGYGPGNWAMQLHTVPMADVVTLDELPPIVPPPPVEPAPVAPPAPATTPADDAPLRRPPRAPDLTVIEGPDGNCSYPVREHTVSELIDVELEAFQKTPNDRVLYVGESLAAVIRLDASGRPHVVRFDDNMPPAGKEDARDERPANVAPARVPGEIYTTFGASVSPPGRHAGQTLEQVIAELCAWASNPDHEMEPGETFAVWRGQELLATVRLGDDREPHVTRLGAVESTEPPAEALPTPKRHRREIPDAAYPPLLRMSTTICPMWDPESPITLEVIVLPAGFGSECEDPTIPDGVPIHRSDLPVLQEAGWTQVEAAGVTLHVRAIQ